MAAYNRLNVEELEAIRMRAEAATIGDWDYDVEDGGISNGNFMVAMGDLDAEGYPVIKAKEVDLEFIAHAREDVPKLLAEIERLNAQLSELIGAIYEYEPDGTALMDLAEAIDNDEN